MKPLPGFRFFFSTSYGMKWLFALCVMCTLIAGVVFHYSDIPPQWETMATWGLALLPFFSFLLLVLGYVLYRIRLAKATFEVQGWPALYAEKDLLAASVWRDLRVEVVLSDNSPERQWQAQLILKKFMDIANGFFYREQRGGRKRQQWSITDSPLVIQGSCSKTILAFLLLHTAKLSRLGSAVDHVVIRQIGKSFVVDAESDTMS